MNDEAIAIIEDWFARAPTYPHVEHRNVYDNNGELERVSARHVTTWNKDAMMAEWEGRIKPKLEKLDG